MIIVQEHRHPHTVAKSYSSPSLSFPKPAHFSLHCIVQCWKKTFANLSNYDVSIDKGTTQRTVTSSVHGRLARWPKWRACDVGEVKERLENELSNPSVALPTSQLILQPFRCFTYVTAHSPTLLSLLLSYRLFTYVTWRAAHVCVDRSF